MRAILYISLFLIPALALAAPGIPHQVHGTVKDFTSGTLNAFIDGNIVGSTSIQSDGTFGTGFNLFFISDSNNTYAGETVTFKISTAAANGSFVFQNGGLNEVAVELIVIGGTSGGIPASTTTTSSNAVGDFNGDGTIDIQDYNFLLVHWGTPQADLNGDGTTDILDFNILIANWS